MRHQATGKREVSDQVFVEAHYEIAEHSGKMPVRITLTLVFTGGILIGCILIWLDGLSVDMHRW